MTQIRNFKLRLRARHGESVLLRTRSENGMEGGAPATPPPAIDQDHEYDHEQDGPLTCALDVGRFPTPTKPWINRPDCQFRPPDAHCESNCAYEHARSSPPDEMWCVEYYSLGLAATVSAAKSSSPESVCSPTLPAGEFPRRRTTARFASQTRNAERPAFVPELLGIVSSQRKMLVALQLRSFPTTQNWSG